VIRYIGSSWLSSVWDRYGIAWWAVIRRKLTYVEHYCIAVYWLIVYGVGHCGVDSVLVLCMVDFIDCGILDVLGTVWYCFWSAIGSHWFHGVGWCMLCTWWVYDM